MTCNGCRSHVEEVLNNMDGVESATVDLDSKTATIKMNHHINVKTFQNALPDKYTIQQKQETNIFKSSSNNLEPEPEKSKL